MKFMDIRTRGLSGVDFYIYKNEEKLVLITESTNYIDVKGVQTDSYAVQPVLKVS